MRRPATPGGLRRVCVYAALLAALFCAPNLYGAQPPLSALPSNGSDSYYPVDQGRSWQYRVYLDGKPADLSVSMTAPRSVAGVRVATQRYDFEHQSSFEFIETDSDKICLRAEKKGGSDNIVDLGEFRCFLKLPVVQGATWSVAADTDLADGYSLLLNAEIVTMDDTVTVPAGTFAHCMKVVASGQKQISYQAVAERVPATVRVTETSWYARGVGLVKRSSTSQTTGSALVAPEDRNKRVSFELVSYKP
jgi:hypothetical protein